MQKRFKTPLFQNQIIEDLETWRLYEKSGNYFFLEIIAALGPKIG